MFCVRAFLTILPGRVTERTAIIAQASDSDGVRGQGSGVLGFVRCAQEVVDDEQSAQCEQCA